jgi:H+-transporting ATPase
MEELLSDKTGTLTENSLSVKELRPRAGISEEELLEAALAASDASTQDPLDMALYAEGKRRKIFPPPEEQRLSFVPFDPSTKRTEALVQEENGLPVRIIKGSPIIMASLGVPESDLQSIKGSGQRTIAVAKGPLGGDLRLLGLVSFSDPLRGDSLSTIQALKDLGIRVRLVTGDTAEAAASVARELGLDGSSCSGTIRADIPEDCQILAGVLPEDKFHLVRILQKKGEIVGMTGDGVNDAPALRQAEVGIAVSTATDIARASAGIILVDPGLSGLIEAVREGRRVYHRMQNYILNKIVKTLEVAFFLTGGLLLFHSYVVSSRMVLLLIFTNDFVTMALASDNVRFSGRPDRWNVRTLAMTAVIISVFWLSLTLSIFYAGRAWLHLSLPSCQTLGFLTLVLTGLGNVLVIRERGSLWKSRPGKFLALALAADILITGILSGTPLLLPPLPLKIILSVLAAVALATLAIDRIKGGLLEKWEEKS